MVVGLGRQYWILWSSSTLANLGDGLRLVALPLIAYSVSDDAVDITLIAVFAALPGLLVGPLAGVVVDRLDRRRVIAVAHALRTLLVLAFALLVQAGRTDLAFVYALAVLLPLFEVFADSAAQPLLSELLPERLLEKGNARLFVARMLAQDVLGSPAAGLLIGVSASLPFFANGATFAGAMVLVLMLRAPARPVEGRPGVEPSTRAGGLRSAVSGIGRDMREGLAAVWRTPLVRAIALTSAVLNFVLLTGSALLVVYAKQDLRLTDEEYALLFTAAAVGSALGGWAAPYIAGRLGTGPTMVLSLVAAGLSRAGFGLARGLWVALGTFFAIGAATFVYNVAVASYLQRVTPNALIGRVYATTQAASYGAAVLAALTAGGLAQVTSPRTIMLAGGIAAIGCGIACWWTTPRDDGARDAREERTPVTAAPGADPRSEK
ncbi:MFS transporter [Streptomyces sp. Ru62]|uniref:MFS transporter n=1 Tax=Streptomyces sp. Ru62 TaxID=2080745 RepID=UPI0015E37D67|nr:MFS transporter [Streptomyces sp. Ru62]